MAYVLILLFELFLLPIAQAAAIVAQGTCPGGTDFEKSGYVVRSARVESPFDYLDWLREAISDADSDVSRLAGRPYRGSEVRAKADELERLNFLPAAIEQRIRVSLVVTSVENCSDAQLDLVYSVLTTQIAPILSGTFESSRAERFAPQESAGTAPKKNRWRFSPSVGYDFSERFYGGARLGYQAADTGPHYFPFDSLTVDGRGSATMHEFSAALNGTRDTGADWLAHSEWQINYLNASDPTDQSRLRQNRLAAQVAAMTQPIGSWHLPLRFGAQLEGGTMRSNFSAADLAHDSVDGSGYGALKLYLGSTGRLARNTFSLSYALEIGSTRPASEVGWLKHIGDIAHDLSLPLGDHRSLDIESRLTAGIIQVPGTIPAPALFFGGNREAPFVPGDSWNIRANPVIRSIPANRFYRTDKGRGGTRFIGYNMTAGIPIWRRPLVPPELTHDVQFTKELHGQLETATNLLQPDYAAKDRYFARAAARLGDVKSALADLQAAVSAAQAAHPDRLQQQFKACIATINTAHRRAHAATQAKGAAQYGDLATLLSVNETEDRLNKAHSACATVLNRELNDAGIAAAAEKLAAIHSALEHDFALIDQNAALRQAQSEMSYVRRTLDTILYDLNFLSVGPVFMFDVAHIGPADTRLGTRYGIGGGLRFTLVSHVDFTLGYAANPKRLAGERPGAFFFSMRFKDLLN